jgi:hypothetical protein
MSECSQHCHLDIYATSLFIYKQYAIKDNRTNNG